MNLIGVQSSKKKKTSLTNLFEVVYFLPLAENHYNEGQCP